MNSCLRIHAFLCKIDFAIGTNPTHELAIGIFNTTISAHEVLNVPFCCFNDFYTGFSQRIFNSIECYLLRFVCLVSCLAVFLNAQALRFLALVFFSFLCFYDILCCFHLCIYSGIFLFLLLHLFFHLCRIFFEALA